MLILRISGDNEVFRGGFGCSTPLVLTIFLFHFLLIHKFLIGFSNENWMYYKGDRYLGLMMVTLFKWIWVVADGSCRWRYRLFDEDMKDYVNLQRIHGR